MTPLAPSDDRKPVPLSYEEINLARTAKNDFERAKIHRLLLTETMRRLRAGRQVERSHGVIHPEMTAIVRDALRLTELVFPGSKPSTEIAPDGPETAMNRGATELSALIARSSLAKVAKVLGRTTSDVKSLSESAWLPRPDVREEAWKRLKIEVNAWDEVF